MGLVSYTLINNACTAAVCVDVNMNLSWSRGEDGYAPTKETCFVQLARERVIKFLISKIHLQFIAFTCHGIAKSQSICVWENVYQYPRNKIYWYYTGVLLTAVFLRCKFRSVISGINLLIRHFGKTASGTPGVSDPNVRRNVMFTLD